MLMQGRGDGREWVTEFLVSFSKDGEEWKFVLTENDETSTSSRVSPEIVDSII